MANKIKGIIIEIGGDTKPLEKALSDVNKVSRNLQSELREIDKLLKLDSGNTELMAQKLKLLTEQSDNTAEKLKRLKEAQEQVNQKFKSGKINDEQYRAFNREIEKTSIELKKLEESAENSGEEIEDLGAAMKEFGIRVKDGSNTTKDAFTALGLNADDFTKRFAKGGESARCAFNEVVKTLGKCDDKVIQNQAGVGLFGTMWEDLGVKAISSLTTTTGEFDKMAATMQEINKIKYNDFGSAIQENGRLLQTELLIPLGNDILPLLNEFANALKNGFKGEGLPLYQQEKRVVLEQKHKYP